MIVQDDFARIEIIDKKSDILSQTRDLRVFYVYEGIVDLSFSDGRKVRLGRDDFYVINSGEAASWNRNGSGFVAILRLKYAYVCEYLDLRHFMIRCGFIKELGGGEERIGFYLREIFSSGLARDPALKAMFLSGIYKLLYLLHEKCHIKKNLSVQDGHDEDADRIGQIRLYIEDNYRERITLEDLADEMHLSNAYLSKYIKKKCGKNFSELLMEYRLKQAEEDLRESEESITSIALDNGFASYVAFTGFFRDAYGETPSEYRRKSKKVREENKAPRQDGENPVNQRYIEIVAARNNKEDEERFNSRSLCAKVSEARSFPRFWSKMINGGAAIHLMRADLQEHLLLLHRELGIEYVRFWDLYAREMMIYDGNEKRRYQFARLDSIIDFLVRNGMHPYMEIGPKPNILLKNSHEYLTVQPRNRIAQTADDFGDFIDQLVRHYIHRYGLEEVEAWYFELWMEVFDKDPEEYMHFFSAVQTRLKMISPKLRLGGPGISSETTVPLSTFVNQWAAMETQPDFISYYSYPYQPPEKPTSFSTRLPEQIGRVITANYVERLVRETKALLREKGFFTQEIHLSEWNSTVANRCSVNDSTHKGAYIVKNLLAMMGEVDLAGYWFASDLFTEFYDTQHIINGSGGLLTKDGIPKPAYYGLSFFNRLQSYLLKQSEDAIITASASGNYSIVCHNYRHPEYRYFVTDEDKILISDYDKYFDSEKREFCFRIEDVKNGTYQIKTRVVDSHHGSIQDEWRRMGLTDHLNDQDIEYLRRISVPHISMETMEVTDNILEIRTILEPNAIENIHIYLE